MIETLIETCHEMDLCSADELQQLGTIADELRAMMDADEGDLEEFITANMQHFVQLWPMIQLMFAPTLARPATSIKMIQRAIISTNSHHEAELWSQTFSPLLPS